jgi:hypothetical protein
VALIGSPFQIERDSHPVRGGGPEIVVQLHVTSYCVKASAAGVSVRGSESTWKGTSFPVAAPNQ